MNTMENLMHASNAVAYVKRNLTLGAWNRMEELEKNPLSLTFQRGRQILSSKPWDSEKAIIETAKKAIKLRCGDCGEQSAVAYYYLVKQNQVIPVEIVMMLERDHGFVLIGRDADTKIGDWRTWNKETVICDPWQNKAFDVAEMPIFALDGKSCKVRLVIRADH